MSKKKVIVIGCGVMGLTSGIRFLEEGYDVKIVAVSLPPDTTSNIAAAYWYPYMVAPRDRVAGWAAFSYKKYEELSKNPEAGVSMVDFVRLFVSELDEPYLKLAGDSFRNAEADELPQGYQGYIAEIPRVETPVYMAYLMGKFQELGGVIQKLDQEIKDLSDISGDTDLIINSTGLGAGKLCDDENVFPIRGQLVRTTNPGLTNVVNDELGPLAVSYIVPRENDCILGGTAQENNWDLEPDPETSKEILRKCSTLEPKLEDADVLEYKVGLRPGRTEVRLELEEVPEVGPVIHNYGHGGAGITLSWGCAEEVVNIAKAL